MTLNRLARRVLEGEEVRNLNHYALGIARMVNLEAGRARQKQKSAVREMQSSAAGASAEAPGMDAMDGCLKGLAPQSRELIERYSCRRPCPAGAVAGDFGEHAAQPRAADSPAAFRMYAGAA